ncbi:receptor-type tyrosine-protein phosphatase N2-like [Tubulanus polymorphus]|uniref:receptor-type tyrosine-protein phosphatase N2-like n=1 Tax=Tubulanus polymorphus TaxID=672921 RepID=UPI003DA3C08F
MGLFSSELEIDKSGTPKYFLLTFILCGCIAGILLAVIALYLVKRHTRARQKLAQLSGQGDPVEASKDYQDLCRQRMQSRASEKPEPLHPAGRINSVAGGNDVAGSPSSRGSSTSSW